MFRKGWLIVCLLLGIILYSGLASAEEQDGSDSDFSPDRVKAEAQEAVDEPIDEDDCSALFGSEEIEARNEARRKAILVRVRESNGIITVMHHGEHWRSYAHGHAQGLDLIGIEKDEHGEFHALIEVSEEVAEEYDCECGVYEVSRDASLFSSAPVLWMNRNLVLLDYDDELAYLTIDPEDRYLFRLVWQSRWTIIQPQEPTKRSSRSKRKRRKSRRRR